MWRASSCMTPSKVSTSGLGKMPERAATWKSPKAKNESKHSPYPMRRNAHSASRERTAVPSGTGIP